MGIFCQKFIECLFCLGIFLTHIILESLFVKSLTAQSLLLADRSCLGCLHGLLNLLYLLFGLSGLGLHRLLFRSLLFRLSLLGLGFRSRFLLNGLGLYCRLSLSRLDRLLCLLNLLYRLGLYGLLNLLYLLNGLGLHRLLGRLYDILGYVILIDFLNF